MLRTLLSIYLVAMAISGHCQKQFSIGYSGSYFTQPGLHLSYKNSFKTITSSKDKIVSKTLLLGGQLGIYHHFNMQTGVYIGPEISLQKQNTNGFRIGYQIGLGALFTQPTNLYKLTNHQYQKVGFESQSNFILTPALSLGKEIKANWADAWHLTNRFMIMPLYTSGSTFRYFFEVGLTKSISS